MTATPNFASDARGLGAADAAAPAGNAGPFVLNLCSSTTPMALAQTDLPELRRFNFFVSRRFEEGRERFRLHMGYFATLAEAEEWLNVVREIYPGAWAGEAPGRKLRERAAAAQAAQAQHAAGPQQQVSAAPAPAAPARTAPAAPPPAPESLALRVPVLKAAPATTPVPAAPRPAAATPAAVKPAVPKTAAAAPGAAGHAPTPRPAAPPSGAPLAPRAPAGTSAAAAAQNLLATAPAPVPGTRAPPPKVATPAPAATPTTRGVFADSNVREVLQALGDASATGQTRLMRAPPLPPAPKEATGAAAHDISDTQVLRLLETRRAGGADAAAAESAPAQEPAHGAIPLLKPDDTGTREALKSAVTSNAPVLFAVQLQWSVQQVELDKVPPLAIFSAYTLYTVEGSRDGRKWFGLRLGFFSDAISAKQVAHYVRSEFTAVAVVPVSPQEKARATDQDRQAATVGAPASAPPSPVDEFKLIDDEPAREEVAKLAARPAPPPAAKPAADSGAPQDPRPCDPQGGGGPRPGAAAGGGTRAGTGGRQAAPAAAQRRQGRGAR